MAIEEHNRTPIGALLVQMRTERKLTQKALALAAGLSASLVALIETGERNASRDAIDAFGRAMSLSDSEVERLVSARNQTKLLTDDGLIASSEKR